ncbi:WYL domain-containing protein [Pasteurella multocida]
MKFDFFLKQHSNYSLTQAERLAFIDIRLSYLGEISRSDIMEEFRIAQAAASKDLSEYRALQEGKVDIDPQSKRTIIKLENFQPLFEISGQNALSILANGFNRNYLIKAPSVIPVEYIEASIEELSGSKIMAITRAIHKNKGVSCRYGSSHSDNHDTRTLIPTTLFVNKNEWYFRAFEYNENVNTSCFKNFKFSRVESSELLDLNIKYKIPPDIDWNTLIPVQIEVNNTLSDYIKDSIRKEFQLKSDTHTLFIKVALFPYIYSSWCIRTEQQIQDGKFAKFQLLNLDLYQKIPTLSEFLEL